MIAAKKMKMLFELQAYINRYRCKAAVYTYFFSNITDSVIVRVMDGLLQKPDIVWDFTIKNLNYEDLSRIVGRIKMDLIRLKKGSTFENIIASLPLQNNNDCKNIVDIDEFLKKGKQNEKDSKNN